MAFRAQRKLQTIPKTLPKTASPKPASIRKGEEPTAVTMSALEYALDGLAQVNKMRPKQTPRNVKADHDAQQVGRTMDLMEGIVANTGKTIGGDTWFYNATKVGVFDHPRDGLRLEAFAGGQWRPIKTPTDLKVNPDYKGFFTREERETKLHRSIVELVNQSRVGVGDKAIWQPYPNKRRAVQLLLKAAKANLE